MRKITINFQIPNSRSELSDKQLLKVYELIASGMDADEIKILCLLRWSDTKLIGRQDNGSYLLKKGSDYFEVTLSMLGDMLPHIDWLEQLSRQSRRYIGRDNKRKRRRWFSRKYFASVINIHEFYADSLSKESCRAYPTPLTPILCAAQSPSLREQCFHCSRRYLEE